MYFSNGNYKTNELCIGIMIAVVGICFALPYFPSFILKSLDANTVWRVQYWGDELNQLFITYGIGVGYGTSYATLGFSGQAISGPFAPDALYTAQEKLFVVGCHNSFISQTFRLGIPGLLLLLGLLLSIKKEQRLLRESSIRVNGFCLLSAFCIIAFNVGIESPGYFFIFAFAIALFYKSINDKIET